MPDEEHMQNNQMNSKFGKNTRNQNRKQSPFLTMQKLNPKQKKPNKLSKPRSYRQENEVNQNA